MTNTLTSVAAILERELSLLAAEVGAYPDDEIIWRTVPGITNSAGTLARHLCGNLRHFIGAAFGETGYQRDRDDEFSGRHCSREDLRSEIERTRRDVRLGIDALDEDALNARHPHLADRLGVETGDFLIHLVSHLGLHLGQIDYHRRILCEDAASLAPQPLPALATATGAGS